MDTTPLDSRPLQASLVLLTGAALYTLLLFQAIDLQAAMRQPGFLQAWLADAQVRFWAWDQFTHTAMVLLLSAPFAWGLTRLFSQRLLPAALMLAGPACAWMILDYFAMRDELPGAPAALNIFYAVDTAKILLVLPLLTLLLRPGPARRA